MIKNIAQIIALDESLPDSMFYWKTLSKNSDFPDWCDAGYFSRCEDAKALSCPECYEGFVDVVWNKDKFGQPHGFRCCPNCGCEEINPNEVKRYLINITRLIADCAQSMGFDPPTEVIPHTAWTLGRRKRKNFIYINAKTSDQIRSIRSMFAKSPETVFIVSEIEKIKSVEAFMDNCVVSFEQFLDWEDHRIVFDRECFDALFGKDEEATNGGHDKKRRAVRLAKIEEIKNYLLAEASSRIGNMDAQNDLGREYTIPKRPRKNELARILKMTTTAVTNCFKDNEGKTIALIYDNLDSFDGLAKIRAYLKDIRYATY